MKSKLFMGGVLCACAASASAEELSGFFLKADVGYNSFTGDYSANSSAEYETYYANDNVLSTSVHGAQERDAAVGSVTVGYIYPLSQWVSAGAQLGVAFLDSDMDVNTSTQFHEEDFGDIYNASNQLDDNISRNSIEPTFDVMLGMTPNDDAMLYALVGVAYNELELDSNHQFVFDNTQIPNQSPAFLYETNTTGSDSNNGLAVRVGVGAIYEITDDWAANATYVYTDYGSVDVQTVADVDNGYAFVADGLQSQSSADVNDQRISLGLSYFF